MHVNGAGAAEVVIAPHSEQDLVASEDAFGMHREELQQGELSVGEVEAASAEFGGERGLVDAQVSGDDDHRFAVGIPRPFTRSAWEARRSKSAAPGRIGGTATCANRSPGSGGALCTEAARPGKRTAGESAAGVGRRGGGVPVTGHPQPRFHLGGAGCGEDDIGDVPFRGGRCQSAFAEDDDDRGGDLGLGEEFEDARGQGQVEAGIGDDDIDFGGFGAAVGQVLGAAAVDPMAEVLQGFGGEGSVEPGSGADVQNPHVLHPPPRRPSSEENYTERRGCPSRGTRRRDGGGVRGKSAVQRNAVPRASLGRRDHRPGLRPTV